MNIKTITYGFKRNMGNYESKYVEATAEIDDEDDPTEAFITLQDWVHSTARKIAKSYWIGTRYRGAILAKKRPLKERSTTGKYIELIIVQIAGHC